MKATQSFFLSLEITKRSSAFEVKNSTDFLESFLTLCGLENSKPTANPGRRSAVMEFASAILLDCHDHCNFRKAVGKLIFMALCRPDMQFAIQQQSTQVFNPTTEGKRAVKQLISGAGERRVLAIVDRFFLCGYGQLASISQWWCRGLWWIVVAGVLVVCRTCVR